MRFRHFVVFVIGILLIAWVPKAAGQQITGTITGSVQDPSGATIVGASVRLTNTGTGATQASTSDSAGNFQFLLLPPGSYSLEAQAQGFKTFRRDGLIVESDRSMAVPAVLTVGQVTETVEVSGSSPLLDPNTSSLGTT